MKADDIKKAVELYKKMLENEIIPEELFKTLIIGLFENRKVNIALDVEKKGQCWTSH